MAARRALCATETALRTATDARLKSLVAALIPPGAGGDDVISAHLSRHVMGSWPERKLGLVDFLNRLDAESTARAGQPLRDLDREEVASLLAELESGQSKLDWPDHLPADEAVMSLVDRVYEGYYAAPGPGNEEPPGWGWLGYSPRCR